MNGYQGEFPVDLQNSKFANYTPADWAMLYVERYGQIDGAHHKTWVLDQVARILKGTPVIVTEARWNMEDGSVQTEYRFIVGDPSKEYKDWVLYMLGEENDGEYEYDYDEGIAP